MGRTIQETISPTKQTSNSTSVSLLNFARLFHQKQIILQLIFLFGISRQKHLPQQRLQLQRQLQKHYDKNFTKDTFLIHSTIIPFLTAMEVNDTRLNIEPSISKEDIVYFRSIFWIQKILCSMMHWLLYTGIPYAT